MYSIIQFSLNTFELNFTEQFHFFNKCFQIFCILCACFPLLYKYMFLYGDDDQIKVYVLANVPCLRGKRLSILSLILFEVNQVVMPSGFYIILNCGSWNFVSISTCLSNSLRLIRLSIALFVCLGLSYLNFRFFERSSWAWLSPALPATPMLTVFTQSLNRLQVSKNALDNVIFNKDLEIQK